jgi:uncharacterized membrane protein
VEKYEQVETSRKKIIINNFLGGISWALGVTVGLALIFIVLGIILKNVNVVPVVGNFISDVSQYVLRRNSGIR